MSTLLRTLAVTMGILLGALGPVFCQPISGQGAGSPQQVAAALDTAKKMADMLNQQHEVLKQALNKATDAQGVQKVLDDALASAKNILERFDEKNEAIQEVDKLIKLIEEKRKEAEEEFRRGGESRWRETIDAWKTRAGTFRELRQALLKQVDRAGGILKRLDDDKKFIQQQLLLASVDDAKKELDKALEGLKSLGDALQQAVSTAAQREKGASGG